MADDTTKPLVTRLRYAAMKAFRETVKIEQVDDGGRPWVEPLKVTLRIDASEFIDRLDRAKAILEADEVPAEDRAQMALDIIRGDDG